MKNIFKLAMIIAVAIFTLYACERTGSFYVEGRCVDSVYLVNSLDAPISLEMHRSPISAKSIGEEKICWETDSCVQKFTLQPNDTVYLDTIVFWMHDNLDYATYPGESGYYMLLYSYKFVQVDYNGRQYEYTEYSDIKKLFKEKSYWYIAFDEAKREAFGW